MNELLAELVKKLCPDTDPWGYYCYLYFEDGELVAAEATDDYTGWYDLRNNFAGSNLADGIGEDMLDLK